MKPKACANEAATLEAIMQPFMSLPVATPGMMMTLMRWMQGELSKLSSRDDGTADIKPEWGTVGQVATIYGMKAARADDYLIAWAAAGKVRVITPPDPLTRKGGHKRYNLADVAACMAETPNTKGAHA